MTRRESPAAYERRMQRKIDEAFPPPVIRDPGTEYARGYLALERCYLGSFASYAPAGTVFAVEGITRRHVRIFGVQTRLKVYGKTPTGASCEGYLTGEASLIVPLRGVRDRSVDGVGGLWWAGPGGVEERAKSLATFIGWPFEALMVPRFSDIRVHYPHAAMR